MTMKLRAPATPLITVDPYFSIWSFHDTLNSGETVHWTGKPNAITGILSVGDEDYLFMGHNDDMEKMAQTSCEIDALSTIYTFETGSVELKLTFTSPLLIDDLKIMARPVSYLKAEVRGLDRQPRKVRIRLRVEDDVCLDKRREHETEGEMVHAGDDIACARMGNACQKVLNKAGDDVRIDWGYFYLATRHGSVRVVKNGTATQLEADAELDTDSGNQALFAFAYDDLFSLQYFGDNLKGYWTKESDDIRVIIRRAFDEYDEISGRCSGFSAELYQSALKCGGEKYAELLMLAYRHVIAAHKLCEDKNGEIIFISKECFSNGCAATVDVTYPSIPLFLLYNPELIKGMLRPVMRFADSEAWPFDFAPHDVGTYPLLNGQVYSGGTNPENQMPIEECGNILITVAALSLAENNFDFAGRYLPTLKKWAEYLAEHGEDPQNQLCTDDFAGHLAHNCNLSVKAIMGIAGFGIIAENLFGPEQSSYYFETARKMAKSWIDRARNQDGTFRLAFDQPGTWSMKYNLVWDRIFRTNIFPQEVMETELNSYLDRMNRYGMPLDNRASYTKSDWLVWCGSMMKKEDFERFIEPLWNAYNESESRVPLTDWYDTVTAKQVGFQHRSVQGGLFIRILMDRYA
ncbi:MAG TPA: DUF4965 domain-containing protein [Clostridiaceae bacterium]|nr:DUF4965 domain-containing protein [Clostridiaceae bacterium]